MAARGRRSALPRPGHARTARDGADARAIDRGGGPPGRIPRSFYTSLATQRETTAHSHYVHVAAVDATQLLQLGRGDVVQNVAFHAAPTRSDGEQVSFEVVYATAADSRYFDLAAATPVWRVDRETVLSGYRLLVGGVAADAVGWRELQGLWIVDDVTVVDGDDGETTVASVALRRSSAAFQVVPPLARGASCYVRHGAVWAQTLVVQQTLITPHTVAANAATGSPPETSATDGAAGVCDAEDGAASGPASISWGALPTEWLPTRPTLHPGGGLYYDEYTGGLASEAVEGAFRGPLATLQPSAGYAVNGVETLWQDQYSKTGTTPLDAAGSLSGGVAVQTPEVSDSMYDSGALPEMLESGAYYLGDPEDPAQLRGAWRAVRRSPTDPHPTLAPWERTQLQFQCFTHDRVVDPLILATDAPNVVYLGYPPTSPPDFRTGGFYVPGDQVMFSVAQAGADPVLVLRLESVAFDDAAGVYTVAVERYTDDATVHDYTGINLTQASDLDATATTDPANRFVLLKWRAVNVLSGEGS